MKVTLISIDLAKTIFQVCGVNQAGKQIFNRQVRRNKLIELLAKYPGVTVAMEACGGSNYWGRRLSSEGREVKIIPPQHVKPFVKGNKNDRNDAFAISEAAVRPNLRCVLPRTLEQTDMILSHKIRARRVDNRTALTNQIRGLLSEYGLVVPAGIEKLRLELPLLIEDAENELTMSARSLFQNLLDEWRIADENIKLLDTKINEQAKASESAKRLTKVKGIAALTATAAVSFAGNGANYQSGRHFSANLGLVPKEHSSGGKQKLGGITKRGNRYLRRLLVQGAWSIIRYVDKSDDRMSKWAKGLIERRGKQKAAIAIANKLARIIWAMLYHKTEFNPA